MKKLLLLMVPLLAFLGGALAGDLLSGGKDTPTSAATDKATAAPGDHPPAKNEPAHGEDKDKDKDAASVEYFRFPNQFFVPIIRNGSSNAVMVLTLSLEIPATARTGIEAREHPLRDALLGALLAEANSGAFDGNFTSEPVLERLRQAMLTAARRAAGPEVRRVLIEDIGRQEV